MAKINIDGKNYEVDEGQNLLHAVLSLGLDLPYFCWHPALGSVGACRQCAVKQFKDEDDTQGRIVMACMTPVKDGVRISVEDPEARDFRAGIIDSLMTNHPHDCPVCDEGGECHLQDMTVMSGHNYRTYRFNKRTFRNQDLGPFINHEMNRCITCYRCVRFYREYADGKDLNAFASKNHVYFGRHEDGALENEFSGNLVEVCPTGVFTDKTLKKHYSRKWDLTSAPSVCAHCALGCNTLAGERYGSLRRILNRYNGEVNGYFLCDRGRFGYEFVNSDKRVRAIVHKSKGGVESEAATREAALERLQALLAGKNAVGIGSPRASIESNFMLRILVGKDRFYAGVPAAELGLLHKAASILRNGPARTPSLREVEQCDAVLVLGEDVTNTAPRLALSLRQASRVAPRRKAAKLGLASWDDAAMRGATQDERGPFYVAAAGATKLDDIATKAYRGAPDEVARLGFAVAHALNHAAPEVKNLTTEQADLASEIAAALKGAKKPLVVTGTGLGSEAVLEAAANTAWALCGDNPEAGLVVTLPEADSMGVALMDGKPLEEVFDAAGGEGSGPVIILENDLYRRLDAKRVDALLGGGRPVVVLDQLLHETALKADLLLPSGAFAECDGTLVSSEGRAQRFFQVYEPGGDIRQPWEWLRDALDVAERKKIKSLDDITAAAAEAFPALKGMENAAPGAAFRLEKMKVPRASKRFSGRTAMLANIHVSEPKPADDPETPFSRTMEGFPNQPPAALTARFWAPGWNSVQSLNKFQEEVAGPMRGGDPGVRLIEPRAGKRAAWFDNIPGGFKREEGRYFIVRAHHIFGSEELSSLSPAVASRAPSPYVALNPDDLASLGAKDGEDLNVKLNGAGIRLPARPHPALPRGVAALPAGLSGLTGMQLPAPGGIDKVGES
ncbi:MAG: NADH-quinone oxidoreductase subunit NuoG [Acidobacteriota bacterium]